MFLVPRPRLSLLNLFPPPGTSAVDSSALLAHALLATRLCERVAARAAQAAWQGPLQRHAVGAFRLCAALAARSAQAAPAGVRLEPRGDSVDTGSGASDPAALLRWLEPRGSSEADVPIIPPPSQSPLPSPLPSPAMGPWAEILLGVVTRLARPLLVARDDAGEDALVTGVKQAAPEDGEEEVAGDEDSGAAGGDDVGGEGNDLARQDGMGGSSLGHGLIEAVTALVGVALGAVPQVWCGEDGTGESREFDIGACERVRLPAPALASAIVALVIKTASNRARDFLAHAASLFLFLP